MKASPLSRLLTSLQRVRWRPPEAVRKVLRRAAAPSLAAAEAEVADWTTPLVDRGQQFRSLDLLVTTAPAVPDATAVAPAAAGPPLRCALVTGGLHLGGLGEVVAFLATNLPAQGVEVMVVDCFDGAGDVRTTALRADIEAAGIGVVTGVVGPADFESVLAWSPDVISGHAAPRWVLDRAVASGIPYVENIHGMHEYFDGIDDEQRRRHSQMAMFVAVSRLLGEQFLDVDPDVPADKVVAIPNALRRRSRTRVDREEARRMLGFEDEFVFVCLARYSLQKNITGLVRAFIEVARRCPDVHLVVAAHREDRFHLAQAVALRERSGVADRIHLRGHTTAPTALLAAADAFVLDAFFEGFPVATLEAAYSGLPVVMSEVAGAAEQIGTDGNRGVVVPNPMGHTGLVDWDAMRAVAYGEQANTAELVAEMEEIAGQRAQWRGRRHQLAASAEQLFRAEDCAAAHADVLRRAAAPAGTRSGRGD